MNSTPLVSVIIVCYNHQKFIKECLVSVLNQSYSNIELLVIDNSDNDESKIIIESLLDENNFFFIKQNNIGLPKTLNKYIPITKGKYCVTMSADDYMLSDRIEKQVNFMEIYPYYAMSYGKTVYVDEDSKQIGFSDTKNFKSGFIFDDLVRFKFHPPAPSYIFRKRIFDEIGLYDENIKYIEDRYMNIKIAEKYQIGYLDDFLSYHRQHPNNLTKTIHYGHQIKDSYYILKQYDSLPEYKSILNDFHLKNYSYFSNIDAKYGFHFMLLALPRLFSIEYLRSTYKLIRKILRGILN
jgi:glycosyltransferase involved in cell wall biosynthesis